MLTRTFGNGPVIPALGLGCWAIGGPWTAGTSQAGWGEVDDAMSTRAIQAAVDRGIRFFDTAQTYGTGHSETVLGAALERHPEVMIGTKVGYAIDPVARNLTGPDASVTAITASLEQSLRRLRRERVDLVHLHLNALPIPQADEVFGTLEALRQAGKIGAYGWSTDFPDRAEALARHPGAVSVQHAMNVFFRADALVPVIERHGLLSINRSPLAMGLLGGKYDSASRIGGTDLRAQDIGWLDYFKGGTIAPAFARQLDAVRDLLQTGGRSLAQGAIGWLWARSERSLPIPGFRTVAQVEDLAEALDKGALPAEVMAGIEAVILREPEGAARER